MGDKNYMDSALVVWVQTFSVERISYSDLIDGVYLNEVYQQIDRRSGLEGVLSKVENVNDKVHNWEVLLKNIKAFFQEVLQQYVILKPPDVCILCYQSDSDSAKDQLDVALLLLLGCAVQCDDKETHVEVMKCMQEDVQLDIMRSIKQITDISKCVLDVNIPLQDIDDSSLILYTHLSNLLKQRDAFIEENSKLHQALNSLTCMEDAVAQLEVAGRFERRNRASCRLSQVQCEMANLVGQAEYRALLRKLKQDILDKGDRLVEMEDEVDALNKEVHKLKSSNFDLTQQARLALQYRDELDVYKEKANQAEKYESELKKLKDKVSEMDYLRERVEELRGDNCLLLERARLMEDQVEKGRQKLRSYGENEVELIRCKRQLDQVLKEQDDDRTRMRMMTTRMELLEREAEGRKRVSYIDDSSLNASMVESNSSGNEAVVSLADQLVQASQSQILMLEAKVQRMQSALDDKVLFSEKFMTMFEIRKEEMVRNGVLMAGGVVGERVVGGGLVGEEGNGVFAGIHDELSCRDLIENKVIRYVSKLRDENIALLERIKKFDENVTELETCCSKLTSEKHDLSNHTTLMEGKCKRISEENVQLENKSTKMRLNEEVMGDEVKQLKGNSRELELKLAGVEEDRETLEGDVVRLRGTVKERNSRLEQMAIHVTELKSDVESMKQNDDLVQEFQERALQLEDKLKLSTEGSLVDKQLITTLREELVAEKWAARAFHDDLSRVRKRCESMEAGDVLPAKFKMLETLNAELGSEVSAKKERTRELEKSLDELKLQVVQLQSELNSPARKVDANLSKDRTLMVTQRFSHSSSATQEILRLKAQLIKVERVRTTLQEDKDKLQEEISSMREQISSLNDSLERKMAKEGGLERLSLAELTLEKSEGEVASLQVDLATSRMQQSALDEEVAQLRVYLAEKEADVEAVTLERRSMEDNCRALQKLHDRLGVEHERLQEELSSLKGVHRLIKTDLKSALDRIASQDKFVAKLQNSSASSWNEATDLRDQMDRQTNMLRGLEEENKRLSADLRRIRMEGGRSKEGLLLIHKELGVTRGESNELRLEVSRLKRIEKLCERLEVENEMLTDQLSRRGSNGADSCLATPSSCDNNTSIASESTPYSIRRHKDEIDHSIVKPADNADSTLKKKLKKSSNNFIKKTQSFLEKKSDSSDNCARRETGSNELPHIKCQENFLPCETPVKGKVRSYPCFEAATKVVEWRKRDIFLKSKSNDFPIKSDSKGSQADVTENETITLNQFLAECNQSPKSRRKLMVSKRVELEDEVFSGDQGDQALTPKSPILFTPTFSLHKSSRAKYNDPIIENNNNNNNNNSIKKINTSWFDRLRNESKNCPDTLNNNIESKKQRFSERLLNLQKAKKVYKKRIEIKDEVSNETSGGGCSDMVDGGELNGGALNGGALNGGALNGGALNDGALKGGKVRSHLGFSRLSGEDCSYEADSHMVGRKSDNNNRGDSFKMAYYVGADEEVNRVDTNIEGDVCGDDDDDAYTVGCGIRRKESCKSDNDFKRINGVKRIHDIKKVNEHSKTWVKKLSRTPSSGQKVKGLVDSFGVLKTPQNKNELPFKMSRPFSADVKKNNLDHSPNLHRSPFFNHTSTSNSKNNDKINFRIDNNNNHNNMAREKSVKVCMVRPATASAVISQSAFVAPANYEDDYPPREISSHPNTNTSTNTNMNTSTNTNTNTSTNTNTNTSTNTNINTSTNTSTNTLTNTSTTTLTNTSTNTLTNTAINTSTNKYKFGVNSRQKPFHEYGCF